MGYPVGVSPRELVDLAFSVVIVLAPPLGFAWIAWEVWRLVAPAWYIARGQYARGRRAAVALGQSLWRFTPGVPAATTYNAALCDLGEGALEDAVKRLEGVPLADLDANLRYACSSALGVALVLLERDAERACDLLDDAVALRTTAVDLFALAHARWMAGDFTGARQAFDRAEATPLPTGPKLGRRTMLWFDRTTLGAQVDLLRGWYLVRLARFDDAKAALGRASAAPFDNVYARRARDLLARVHTGTTFDDEAAPSSLGPIVVP
jgi:hypothetical protein